MLFFSACKRMHERMMMIIINVTLSQKKILVYRRLGFTTRLIYTKSSSWGWSDVCKKKWSRNEEEKKISLLIQRGKKKRQGPGWHVSTSKRMSEVEMTSCLTHCKKYFHCQKGEQSDFQFIPWSTSSQSVERDREQRREEKRSESKERKKEKELKGTRQILSPFEISQNERWHEKKSLVVHRSSSLCKRKRERRIFSYISNQSSLLSHSLSAQLWLVVQDDFFPVYCIHRHGKY